MPLDALDIKCPGVRVMSYFQIHSRDDPHRDDLHSRAFWRIDGQTFLVHVWTPPSGSGSPRRCVPATHAACADRGGWCSGPSRSATPGRGSGSPPGVFLALAREQPVRADAGELDEGAEELGGDRHPRLV